jgi:hypothetical protein
MKIRSLLPVLALTFGLSALAAPPDAVLLDFSSQGLIDGETARRVVDEGLPAKLWKVYPVRKWGFVSQVEGGVTATGVCVVTARVMMVPLTPTKAPLWRPAKVATAFDAAPAASADQCRQLAQAKLGEATRSVASSLVKT